MNKIDKELLAQVADLHKIPQGTYNIRKNGKSIARNSTKDIEIVPKPDKSGIDIIVKANVVNKSVHIPVILTEGNLNEAVYNDFYIGENSDVTIVAGCGIHNTTCYDSEHDGIHSFYLAKNCKVKYVEKHLGSGNGTGKKILNPQTYIEMQDGSLFEMETIQLEGVSYSNRKTKAKLLNDTKLVIKEKVLTTDTQTAITQFDVDLKGKNSSVEVISRSVAKNKSKQKFLSNIKGKNECFGHVECDGIVLDNAIIESTPKIIAQDVNATLVHEAAIGKIAGEQLTKLMSLGLSQEQAEEQIIKGFLK